ncbi:Zn-finger protein [Haloferax tailed virus 1]|uniref:Zn-finger protein n=1 Tax=Haloferax tailed virus 1 TaxID=2507575 RepID=A0A410N6Q1_HFTV1|nr:Zn-finger protein [Haloferax tailed virus 1]QAS68837.1 Zn-finger protein [Haloferax tailed virus 1]
MSDESGGWLTDAVSDGIQTVRETVSFLGVEREKHVCDHCNVACEETFVFDVRQAAFDDGQTPAWECPECEQTYYRETGDESHTMDLYDR